MQIRASHCVVADLLAKQLEYFVGDWETDLGRVHGVYHWSMSAFEDATAALEKLGLLERVGEGFSPYFVYT
jgi:uncharacterized protein YutD